MNAHECMTRERELLHRLPGARDIMATDEPEYAGLAAQYPDTAFSLMIIENMYRRKNTDLGRIYGRAYWMLLNGESFDNIRSIYDWDMENYLRKHNCDN